MPKAFDSERNLWWQVLAWIGIDTVFKDEIGVDPVGRVFRVDAELSAGEDDGLCGINQVLVSVGKAKVSADHLADDRSECAGLDSHNLSKVHQFFPRVSILMNDLHLFDDS